MSNFRNLFLAVSVAFAVLLGSAVECTVVRVLTETIQNNVAGEPLTHEKTEWNFDPEDAYKRRALFYEVNGYRANKYIERIGVGLDGKQEERRAAQAVRDYGRLNGEHVHNFP